MEQNDRLRRDSTRVETERKEKEEHARKKERKKERKNEREKFESSSNVDVSPG